MKDSLISLYFKPGTSQQIMFEEKLIENNIQFIKQNSFIRRALIVYQFYQQDMQAVDKIRIEVANLFESKRPTEKVEGSYKILILMGIIILSIIILILIFR